jgi:hypothetical protein
LYRYIEELAQAVEERRARWTASVTADKARRQEQAEEAEQMMMVEQGAGAAGAGAGDQSGAAAMEMDCEVGLYKSNPVYP